MRSTRLTLAGLCLVTLFAAVDCSSNYVSGQSESCANNKIDTSNGETDVDCGGKYCDPCAESKKCTTSTDCASGLLCSGTNTCVWAHCTDGLKNGDETGIDCGGGCPTQCSAGMGCKVDKDCDTAVCTNEECAAASCTDSVKNQGESATDCGDPSGVCDRCAPGKECTQADNCDSHICKNGSCTASACDDATKNGSESDIDCGGSCPNRCQANQSCVEMKDCDTGVCATAKCQAAACNDSVKNGSETDKDCGGNCTAKCAVGQGCSSNNDCMINSCSAGTCSDPSCSNNTLDGTETALDCGGDRCAPCADALACIDNKDCISKHCVAKSCGSATCSDQLQNGLETDIDCGGDCTQKCDVGLGCGRNQDCGSGKCSGGKCQAPACTDGVKNDLESDVDCGGSVCVTQGRTCDNGRNCREDADCRSAVCNLTTGMCQAQSCTDNHKNQDETDVDCGGVCSPCADKLKCLVASDCVSSVCDTATTRCLPPNCSDKVKNGLEGDTDCGAICIGLTNVLCGVGKSCKNDADCVEQVCGANGFCLKPSCSDGVKNGAELDKDCMDPVNCPTKKCLVGQTCNTDADCDLPPSNPPPCFLDPKTGTKVCTLPNCTDGVKARLDETDIDCGGVCPPCAAGKTCLVNLDCSLVTSGYCLVVKSQLTCVAKTCTDSLRNGGETDIDCGGSDADCKPCMPGKACTMGSDCDSGVCTGNICQAASCKDNTQNGTETGLDCGGGGCPACGDGQKCLSNTDCANNWCKAGTSGNACTTPTCNDSIKNGLETDIDCGGTICTNKCGDGTHGNACKTDTDCAKGWCKEWLGTCSLVDNEWSGACLPPAKTGPCTLAPVGGACSDFHDCQTLTCDATSGKCAAANNCAGQLLTAPAGTPKICTVNNAADKPSCESFIRCFYARKCSPINSDACYYTANGGCGNSTSQNEGWYWAGQSWSDNKCTTWDAPKP